jgi:hypothetical protein
VVTWNSTAAEPTPIRLGPRPSTPCALAPWQLMQFWSNSALPSSAVRDSCAASAACEAGATAI